MLHCTRVLTSDCQDPQNGRQSPAGLERISIAASYGIIVLAKLTLHDLKALKGKRQLTYVQVTTKEQAAAAEEAGIDMMGTAFVDDRKDIPSAAPQTHFRFGLQYGCYTSPKAILGGAFAALESGASSVYTAQSMDFVSVMAREGIAVCGHVGLVPPLVGWTGGFCAVGKSADQAGAIFQKVKDYENAGAFAVEIEVVPHRVATEISRRTSLVTISMGAGTGCDVQYLYSSDILGETAGRFPRHAKVYRDFKGEYERLQRERVAAYQEFSADVASGAFPSSAHLVNIEDKEFEDFIARIDRLNLP